MDDVAERGGVNVDLRGVEAEEDDVCVRFEIGIAVEIFWRTLPAFLTPANHSNLLQ